MPFFHFHGENSTIFWVITAHAVLSALLWNSFEEEEEEEQGEGEEGNGCDEYNAERKYEE